MDTHPPYVVARVPIVVRCLDAHGRPVSLSTRALSQGSTDLQDLLRWAYGIVRPHPGAETVTVSFLEEPDGRLQLEYLVVDRAMAPRRWFHRRCRRRAEEVQTALMQATIAVTTLVETVGSLATACSARWEDSDSPDFVNLVLDDTYVQRVPRTVVEALEDPAAMDLLRGTLTLFVENGVEQLIIGKDPEIPGRYRETVVGRSPALMRFLAGEPLPPLVDGLQGPGRS